MKQKKIMVNDNLVEIWEYIYSAKEPIKIYEFMQMCKDYQIYEEAYLNWHILKDMIAERNVIINEQLEKLKLKDPLKNL